jgi:hypothetical protein
MFSFIKDMAKLSSKGEVSFCLLTSNQWEFLLLYILASSWYCHSSWFGSF